MSRRLYPGALVLSLLLEISCGGSSVARSECVDYSAYLRLTGLMELPATPCSVIMAGSFAYAAGGGTGLYVIDVSDMSTPLLASSLPLPCAAMDLALDGDFVYVAGDANGMLVVDVTDPRHPALVAECPTPAPASAISVHGDIACVVMSNDKLGTIDISDPLNPRLLGTLGISGFVKEVTLVGTMAYVASSSGLRIVDVSLPERPRRVDVVESGYGGQAVEVRDGYAYVAAASNGLRILDVSNAQYPQPVSILPVPASADAVTLAGSWAFILDRGRGLLAVDISDVAHPFVAAEFPTFLDPRAIAIAGHFVIIGGGNRSLEIVDATHLTNPIAEGSFTTGWTSDCSVTEDGRLAFLAQDSCVTIVELTSLDGPRLVCRVGMPSYAKAIALAGRYAYVADYAGGLQLIDVGDPASAHVVGSVATGGRAIDVVVAGTTAYVASEAYGVEIIDVSIPERPRVVGVHLNWNLVGIAIRGSDLITVASYSGYGYSDYSDLSIIDVSNPQDPRERAILTYSGYSSALAISGSHAYATCAGDEMRVIDLSNMAAPRCVGHVRILTQSARSIAISGTTAVVGRGLSGLAILDISDPARPVEVGHCGAGFDFLCADIVDDTVYAGGYASTGFKWFGLPCASASVVADEGHSEDDCSLQIYPNPASSTVAFSSGCDKSPIGRVEVYDLAGRRLRLIEGGVDEGTASGGRWDGRDDSGTTVAAGIYVIRAATSAGVRTAAVTLIR